MTDVERAQPQHDSTDAGHDCVDVGHDCLDFLVHRESESVETHGLDCPPYEHFLDEWEECSLCGKHFTDNEVRQMQDAREQRELISAATEHFRRQVAVENGVYVYPGDFGKVYLQKSELEFILRMAAEKKNCRSCAEIAAGGFGPRHEGSTGCQSGSLASGGNVAHCTCDTCF